MSIFECQSCDFYLRHLTKEENKNQELSVLIKHLESQLAEKDREIELLKSYVDNMLVKTNIPSIVRVEEPASAFYQECFKTNSERIYSLKAQLAEAVELLKNRTRYSYEAKTEEFLAKVKGER
jgi:cellulose biosynthesis protein BcsQ